MSRLSDSLSDNFTLFFDIDNPIASLLGRAQGWGVGPVQTERQLAIFNRVSRIAASTVGAPISFITLRRDRQLSVLGSHGIYLRDFDESWSAASALVRRETMTYVKDVRRELQLRDHPLLKAAPFVRSMAHIPASGYNSEFEAAITILDPAAKWPFPATMSAILTDLAMLVGDGLSAGVGKATNNTNNDSIGSGLNENGDPIKVQPPINDYNTAAKFLISTLQERSSIRSRKDISFLTLRTWSKAIKAFQIEALRIVKLNPDPEFVKLVAEEFAQQQRRLHGTPSRLRGPGALRPLATGRLLVGSNRSQLSGSSRCSICTSSSE